MYFLHFKRQDYLLAGSGKSFWETLTSYDLQRSDKPCQLVENARVRKVLVNIEII